MTEKVDFTKQMRKVTKEIHSISDALVNAKLGVALSDNKVWAEGILVFYEIFKFLESAMDRNQDSLLAELDIEGIRCTTSFEQDLQFYLGENWKISYIPRPVIKEYLSHLKKLEESDPDRLLAYVYHLYMGLFSGGQILKKKREIFMRLTFSNRAPMEGLAIVNFDNKSAYNLKKEMREAMNRIAEFVDEETRQKFLEESKMVFILNNKIIHSVEGVNDVVIRKFIKLSGIVAAAALVAFFVHQYYNKS